MARLHAGHYHRQYGSSSGPQNGQPARGMATETSSDGSRKTKNRNSTFEDVRSSAYSEEGDFVQAHIEAAMEANVYDREMAIVLAETQAAMNDPGSFDREKFRKEAELAELEFAIPGNISLCATHLTNGAVRRLASQFGSFRFLQLQSCHLKV